MQPTTADRLPGRVSLLSFQVIFLLKTKGGWISYKEQNHYLKNMSAISTMVLCNSDKLGMNASKHTGECARCYTKTDFTWDTWAYIHELCITTGGAGTNLFGYHCGVTVLISCPFCMTQMQLTQSQLPGRLCQKVQRKQALIIAHQTLELASPYQLNP